MKYIFFSFNGLGYPLAYKLMQEGHEVIVGRIEDIKDYVIEEEAKNAVENEFSKERRLNLFKGILDFKPAEEVVQWMKKVKNPHEYFVFFEENNLYRWADKIQDLGFEGIFPTKDDYFLEIDRNRAKEFVAKYYAKQLHSPEVVTFSKVEDGVAFLKDTKDIWVLKPNKDGVKTFVPDVTDVSLAKKQIREILCNFPEKYEQLGFIFEKYIPSIIELTPEKIYYDGVPLATSLDIENKPIGAGNISVQTGCAEDLVFPTYMDDRINKIAFPDMVDKMARKHKGLFIWDASILIDKKDGKMYFGEFCANRPGYNAFFTQLAQLPSVNNFFESLVHKQSPFQLGTVGTSVRIFNFNRDEHTQQLSPNITIDFKPEIEKDLWLWDTWKNERGQLLSVGANQSLAVITGANKSIDDAVAKMYKNVDALSFVGAYYRSKDDFLSLDYPTSIPNRLNYGMDRGLYTLPFNVKLGEIKGVK